MSKQLGYTDEELRRLATTEPDRRLRAQYAQMLKQSQGEMRKGGGEQYELFDNYARTGKYDGHSGPFSGGLDDTIARATGRLNGNKSLAHVSIRLRDAKDQGGYGDEVARVTRTQDGDVKVTRNGQSQKAASAPMSKAQAWRTNPHGNPAQKMSKGFAQPGKLKPNDVHVSFHTGHADDGEKEGVKYWTAIMGGYESLCPSWPDEERVRRVAEQFHLSREGKGGNIYLWDGDRGQYLPYDRQIDAKEAGRPQINAAPYRR